MEEKHSLLKKLLIAIALILFILFCASQKQAHALTYKGTIYDSYQNGNDRSGSSLSGNGQKDNYYYLSSPKDYTSYDFVGFRINQFSTYFYDSGYNTSCTGSQNLNNGNITLTCTPNYGGSSYVSEAFTLTANGIWRSKTSSSSSDNFTMPCWFSSEYQDTFVCPVEKNSNLIGLDVIVKYSTVEVFSYNLTVTGLKLALNSDNTDIVVQQGQTNTILQQQQDIMTGTDTTGASTNGINDINSSATAVSSELDSVVGTGDFVSIFTTFFSQIDNSTCTPITLPIPYTNENLVLPCLGTEFQNRVPLLWTLYTTIITGVIVFRFWRFYIDMFKHLLDPYSTGLHGVSDIAGGGK